MIWAAGRIVPDESLSVGVLDRAFEHGLGLFETFRTWDGRARLLDRHLARLSRSARDLGIPLEPSQLPDAGAVSALLRANGVEGDAMLRITTSGGAPDGGIPRLWMRSGPLPPPAREGGAIVEEFWEVAYDDPTARHKCLNYWPRRIASDRARSRGADEALSRTPDGRIWEGSRTNLFLIRDGLLTTPPADGPIVPGILRGAVLERARGLGLEAGEGTIDPGIVERADEAFLTNSVRGVIPVRRIGSKTFPAPGPRTSLIGEAVASWLDRGVGTD